MHAQPSPEASEVFVAGTPPVEFEVRVACAELAWLELVWLELVWLELAWLELAWLELGCAEVTGPALVDPRLDPLLLAEVCDDTPPSPPSPPVVGPALLLVSPPLPEPVTAPAPAVDEFVVLAAVCVVVAVASSDAKIASATVSAMTWAPAAFG